MNTSKLSTSCHVVGDVLFLRFLFQVVMANVLLVVGAGQKEGVGSFLHTHIEAVLKMSRGRVVAQQLELEVDDNVTVMSACSFGTSALLVLLTVSHILYADSVLNTESKQCSFFLAQSQTVSWGLHRPLVGKHHQPLPAYQQVR